MDTKSLIESLSQDLNTEAPSRHWGSQFWFSWVSCFSLMALLTYLAAAFFPADIHLPTELRSFSFWTEAVLWFFASLFSARVAYYSSIPGALRRKVALSGGIAVAGLSVYLLLHITPSAFANEFTGELHWDRGPCGMFIGVTGFLSLLWLSFVFRRAAPTRVVYTTVWGALSVGCLASMLMHLVCTRENSAHVLLWHVAPLVLLTLLSAKLSNRLIRW